jgi:UDP-N-acetylglucosamine:LPS N-acetylglucosamine transferase
MAVGERYFVAVFGGSLGARRINQAVERTVADWDGPPLVVHHVVGRRDWASEDTGEYGATPSVDYRRVAYEDDMPSVLAASDLVICRSGATSVAELAVLGLPSVLIPLPGAPDDHQSANAQQLAEAGGAVVVKDEELSGDHLRALIGALLSDGKALTEMASGARTLGRPDAADRVADLVALYGGFNGS